MSFSSFISLAVSAVRSCPHLRSAAPVDEHADGTVRSAAAHEQVSSVERLHHADEVPTAVLEHTQTERGEI